MKKQPKIEISGILASVLMKIARDLQVAPEDLIVSLVKDKLDPQERIMIYLSLFRKYIAETDELLKKGEITQAGEKLWGAITELLNIIGEIKESLMTALLHIMITCP